MSEQKWEIVGEQHFLKRVESFRIIEDSPTERFQHVDQKIREAITPAILLLSGDGKEILMAAE